jgi:hypothetical protein
MITPNSIICPSGIKCKEVSDFLPSPKLPFLWQNNVCSSGNCSSCDSNDVPCWYRNIPSGNPQIVIVNQNLDGISGFGGGGGNYPNGTYPLRVLEYDDNHAVLYTQKSPLTFQIYPQTFGSPTDCGTPPLVVGTTQLRVIITVNHGLFGLVKATEIKLDNMLEGVVWPDGTTKRRTQVVFRGYPNTTACSGTFILDTFYANEFGLISGFGSSVYFRI